MGLFGKKKKEEPEDPAEVRKKEVDDLIRRYDERLKKDLEGKGRLEESDSRVPTKSVEYQVFRESFLPKRAGWYEKACNFSEKILKIAPDKKKREAYLEALDIAHIQATPEGVSSLAILGPVTYIFIGFLISILIFNSFFFAMFFLLTGAMLLIPLQNYPLHLANIWRMKASNQMVICIFYVVTYMRHTSNLELAIRFAADHLSPPLSIDLAKVLWNVETEKCSNIKESLDAYLKTWKKWNMEFIEAFHLIEGSLYESSDDRRLELLDKSLDLILEETYEKMLHYAQDLKSPVTILNMLGIILPILGLVILPLVVSFMCQVQWYHIAILYNIFLPVVVFYMGNNILSTRPTGYGDTDVSEQNPELQKHKNLLFRVAGMDVRIKPLYMSILVAVFFCLIAISPMFLHVLTAQDKWDLIITTDDKLMSITGEYEVREEKFALLGYKESKGCPPGEGNVGDVIGPFGLGAALLSIGYVLAAGIGLGLFFMFKSKNVIKIRERSKKLENEFAAALFQLGNRLGDGIPVEMAFGKVAQIMEGTTAGAFFETVSGNITRMGVSVDEAIFNPKYGALIYYPSRVIESSMKVLTESVRKGPMIAAQAMISVARYIKEIHRVNERLKDLMSDVISSMKGQVSFLTPLIAGIVIGITSMISTILGKLGKQLREITEAGGGAGGGGGVIALFGDGVPTYYFQVIVGIYVVQITYILTILINGIENGEDTLAEQYSLGKNLIKSTILYCIIALGVIFVFNMIAGSIIGKIALT